VLAAVRVQQGDAVADVHADDAAHKLVGLR